MKGGSSDNQGVPGGSRNNQGVPGGSRDNQGVPGESSRSTTQTFSARRKGTGASMRLVTVCKYAAKSVS